MTVQQLTPPELLDKLRQDNNTCCLDVREPFEFQHAKIAGSLLIPLGQIHQRLDELDAQQDIVVICHHGIRSQQAADFLEYSGFTNIFNLAGGIDAWSCQCDPSIPRY